MYIGNFKIGKQEVSIALMILFAMTAMFFIGYRYAYDKAITYANEQIEEKVNEFKINKGFVENPDILLGNIPPLDIGGIENE